MLRNMDQFAHESPRFRVGGREKFPTTLGGVVTVFMFSILSIYSLIKLEHLLSRSNPNISSFTEPQALPADYRVMLKEKNFQFAWAFESHHGDRELKDDPRFVKISMNYYGIGDDLIFRSVKLDYHICTKEDFD